MEHLNDVIARIEPYKDLFKQVEEEKKFRQK